MGKEKKYNCIYCGRAGGGYGGDRYSNMKLVYMCRIGFKNGGLGSGPSLKMWGFQSGHSREKQGILKIKITKKRIFFKTRVFSICPGRKSRTKNCIFLKRRSFGATQIEKVGVPPLPPPPMRNKFQADNMPFSVTCEEWQVPNRFLLLRVSIT